MLPLLSLFFVLLPPIAKLCSCAGCALCPRYLWLPVATKHAQLPSKWIKAQNSSKAQLSAVESDQWSEHERSASSTNRPVRVRHAVLVEWLALWLIVRRNHRGRRCERTSAIAHKSMKRYTYSSIFFLEFSKKVKALIQRQSADLSSKISVELFGHWKSGTTDGPWSTTLDRSMCNEFLEHLFLYYRRPEEASEQENACLYSHPHGHSSFFNLKALCILIVVRQKDRQVREHPCHSHTRRTTNNKVNPGREVISGCKTSARCKSQQKIKGKKSTNRNSTSEIFEFDSRTEPVGAQQILAAADQRVAVDFLSITAQSWRKQTKPVLPWND